MKKILLGLSIALALSACSEDTTEEAVSNEEQASEKTVESEELFDETESADVDLSGLTKVKITTEYGDMIAVLYDDTPEHKKNFLKLAKDGFYKDHTFHRVIKGFMIQGGDPNSKDKDPNNDGQGGPGYTLPAEIKPIHFHKKGALSAARLGDAQNPEKRSSGSQFYVVQGNVYNEQQLQQQAKQQVEQRRFGLLREVANRPENAQLLQQIIAFQQTQNQKGIDSIITILNPAVDKLIEERGIEPGGMGAAQITAYSTVGGAPHLDNEYTVFGEVIEGLDVIDKIAEQQVAPGSNRPLKDIKMNVELVSDEN